MSREFVIKRLSELLELPTDDTKCINLEKSIYNWAIKKSNSVGDTPASDNHRHVNRYKSKFLEIQKCLRNSDSLKLRILTGQLKTYDSTISGHFTLDIRGFQFKDDQGKSRSIYVLDRDVSNTYYHFYHKI